LTQSAHSIAPGHAGGERFRGIGRTPVHPTRRGFGRRLRNDVPTCCFDPARINPDLLNGTAGGRAFRQRQMEF